MQEATSINKNTREFTANGKKYILKDRLSIARFKEYEKLVPHLTFGIGFDEMFAGLKKIYNHLNSSTPKPLDAGIIAHNLMSGIAEINDKKRIHPALKMADALLMADKISDWEKEGLDMMPFFELSLSTIQGFNERLIEFTQDQKKKEA
jgi:hypothetical protein